MTPDREQIRRNALHYIDHDVLGRPIDGPHASGCQGCVIDALLSELEQADRERDDCKAAYAVLERRMTHE